jgi:hypothetical protein
VAPSPEAVQAASSRLQAHLVVAVSAAFDPYIRLLGDVLLNNPRPAGQILVRPDVVQQLEDSIRSAASVAEVLAGQAWRDGGGPDGAAALGVLRGDVARALGDLRGQVEGIVREQMGIPAPGPAGRIQAAVRGAVQGALTRARMSLGMAAGYSRTEAVLAEGRVRQAAGVHVMKVWKSRLSRKTCRWCRELHGMMIPLEDEFPHGDPVALPQDRTRRVATPAGMRRYHRSTGQPIIFTHPPRPWLGRLAGPLRHPRCECWLELVIIHDETPPPSRAGLPPPGAERSFVRASDIAALPDPQYRGLIAFLRAATHELGQLLRRLKGL